MLLKEIYLSGGENFELPPGSLSKYLQRPAAEARKLGTWNSTQVSHMGGAKTTA